MNQKNILCFGDSNTHGYNSKTGGRFTVEERWTKLLQRKLGDDYYVIEEGLSGRTTSFDDPVFEGLSGLNAIYPCMMTHEPLDLVIIMLGTNDTKTAVAGEMGDKCVERSRALAKEFKDVADRLGCHFIDAGSISGIEMYPYDWMHLSLDSHRIFAEYLAEYLPKIV